jgi:N6-L-threonylcarbamoyladenine synthase
VAEALGVALGIPTLPVHHLEGHLLSPLLSADPPAFPFVAAGLGRPYAADAGLGCG